jgi:hypothetical protein
MDAPLCKGKGVSNRMLWDWAISIECVQVCKKQNPASQSAGPGVCELKHTPFS